jgi:hypothetical protein
MKKVIFILGTSYSGSTMLDMIISNDKLGYSLGEITALFRPYRAHHFDELEKLKERGDFIDIINKGERNLYQNIFIAKPEIEFLVDSSKDVFWVKDNVRRLKKQGIDTHLILIHKNIYQIANSYFKRGILNDWSIAYLEYHRKIFTCLSKEKIYFLSYNKLIEDKTTLEKLCSHLDIDFFENKICFWDKKHETFFGNNRTRFHTNNETLGEDQTNMYHASEKRTLRVDSDIPFVVINTVDTLIRANKNILLMQEVLNNNISTDLIKKNSKLYLYFLRYIKPLIVKRK